MAKKRPGQIINPLVGFGQRAIGPYANRIGQSTYARNVNVGELDLPADFQAFGTVGSVIKALVKGEGAVTFSRSTEASVTDFEDIVKTALVNEIRFENGRRVENLGDDTENLEASSWTPSLVTVDSATECTFTGQFGSIVQVIPTLEGSSYTLSFKARNIDGNTNLLFRHASSATGNTTALTVDSTLKRYSVTVLGRAGDGNVSFGIQDNNTSGYGQIEFTEFQVEEVTGQSNQNPSEYVSVGVGTGSDVLNPSPDSVQSGWVDNGDGSFDGTSVATNRVQWNAGSAPTIANKTYVLTLTISNYSSGWLDATYGGTGGFELDNLDANGTYTATFVSAGDDEFWFRGDPGNAFTGTVSNISIKEADHGAFVDGVRYYARTNPNEVDGNNVVTQTAATTPLNDYRALFEPAATSYIAEPEDFTAGANWTGTGNLDGSESTTDSSLQGRKLWKLAATLGSTGTHTYVSSTHTKDAAVETWIGSIICRPDDPEVPWIALTVENGAGGEFGQQFFQLSDGSKGTFNSVTWTVDDAGSEQLANGDYRYWIKVTTNTTTNIRLRVSAANADNGDFFNLPQDKGFFVQGANLVEEEVLSSYIGGTGSSSYSRTADDGNPMFDYANWSQEEGTWYLDAWISDYAIGVSQAIFSIRDPQKNSILYEEALDLRTRDTGGSNNSVAFIPTTPNNQFRLCCDFGTGSTIETGFRDIEGSGNWRWDDTPLNYSGAFETGSVMSIVTSITRPIRLVRFNGYTTRKGKDWMEDNE